MRVDLLDEISCNVWIIIYIDDLMVISFLLCFCVPFSIWKIHSLFSQWFGQNLFRFSQRKSTLIFGYLAIYCVCCFSFGFDMWLLPAAKWNSTNIRIKSPTMRIVHIFQSKRSFVSLWQLQNKVEKKPCHSGDRERIERGKKESSKIHDIGWDPRQIRTASFHFRYVFGHHIHILVVYVCWIIITAAMFKRKSVSEMLALLTWSFVKIQYEWIHFEQWI